MKLYGLINKINIFFFQYSQNYNKFILNFKYKKILKRLKEQLIFPNIKVNKDKTIFFLQIETSHYLKYLSFILAKGLEIKGYKVYFLVCDGFLNGCEIKSINNNSKNQCIDCKFSISKILKLFELNKINLKDFIINKQIEKYYEIYKAKDIKKINDIK